VKDLRKQFVEEITERLEKLDPETECVWDECPMWLLERGEHHVNVTLVDSETCEGTSWDEGGFNISVVITNEDGTIEATYCPYNYTPRGWTNDPEELRERVEGTLDGLEREADSHPNHCPYCGVPIFGDAWKCKDCNPFGPSGG